MKKKLLLGLCILASTYSSNAQFGDISSKQLEVLKNSKLLVVKSGSHVLDSLVQFSMEESWDFTPYEIVSQQEAQSHYGDPGYSFLTFVSYSHLYGMNNLKFSNLVLLLTKKRDRKEGKLDFIRNKLAYIPLDNYEYTKPTSRREFLEISGDNTFFYKWNDLFRGFTNFLKLAEENNGMSLKALKKHFMMNKDELKDHTLLIESSQLSPDLQEDKGLVSDIYLFDYKMTSHNEIYEAIKDKSSTYAYFYTAPTSSWNFTVIMEAGTGKILLLDSAGGFGGAVGEKISRTMLKIMMLQFR